MRARSAVVWPPRTWDLSTLTEEQYARWESDGYLVIPDAVPPHMTAAAASAVREFVGADDADPDGTWYTNTLDIYSDTLPDGRKPHHGPCGMVQMSHHASLWAIRQCPRLHGIFADLYGTRRLFVTIDRAHFKPPQSASHPAWSDPGEIHKGLHWDVDTRESEWPVPYVIQGVVYLEDTAMEQGALRVVPGFHRRVEAWSASQPADRGGERPPPEAAEALGHNAVAAAGSAGSLVVWHSSLPHGPAANVGAAPRVSAYVTMLPVDAAPFLGPGRPADTPLGLSDAGTLAFLEDLCLLEDGGTAVRDPPDGAASRTRRQSRERRAERWRHRLPMLDEDPREAELPRLPPGEEQGAPAELTPLGARLVGLVPWEADDDLPADLDHLSADLGAEISPPSFSSTFLATPDLLGVLTPHLDPISLVRAGCTCRELREATLRFLRSMWLLREDRAARIVSDVGFRKRLDRLERCETFSSDGERLFTVDRNNHRVICAPVGGDGEESFQFGSKGSGPGQLRDPYGIASHDGLLFVADHGNDRVSVFDEGGIFVRSIGGRRGSFLRGSVSEAGYGAAHSWDAAERRIKEVVGVAVLPPGATGDGAGRLLVTEFDGRLLVLGLPLAGDDPGEPVECFQVVRFERTENDLGYVLGGSFDAHGDRVVIPSLLGGLIVLRPMAPRTNASPEYRS